MLVAPLDRKVTRSWPIRRGVIAPGADSTLRFCDTDVHQLVWTFALPDPWLGIFRTGEHLLGLGYRSVTRVPVRLRLRHGDGHVVELVAQADAVRIEVDPATPPSRRALAARAIAADIAAASRFVRVA